jgi:hypothetical protein
MLKSAANTYQPLEIAKDRLNAGAAPVSAALPLLKAIKRFEPPAKKKPRAFGKRHAGTAYMKAK